MKFLYSIASHSQRECASLPHRTCSPDYQPSCSVFVVIDLNVVRHLKILAFFLLNCSSVIAQVLGFSSAMRALACLQPLTLSMAFLFFSFHSRTYFLICVYHIPAASSGPTIGCPALVLARLLGISSPFIRCVQTVQCIVAFQVEF